MQVPQRKKDIVRRLCECFTNYKQVIVVKLDNVSTNQIHKARNILRTSEHKGEMIIGKNTLIKKALKFVTQKPEVGSVDYEDHKNWNQRTELLVLEPLMIKNIGLIFSDAPYLELKKLVEAEVVKQPARTGIIAPCDVVIPAGPTGVEVGKIDLFHKLNISCKTVKSAVEVVKEVKIITKGQKVGEGATQMCKVLNIIPFEYALGFIYVFLDGCILDESIIEMPPSTITDKFKEFSGFLTALSVGANIPNSLSVPHLIKNSFKDLMAIGLETDYKFAALEKALEAGKNSGPSQATDSGNNNEKVEEKAAPVEEEEASEDMDCCGLFD